jgi:hypothetical protein
MVLLELRGHEVLWQPGRRKSVPARTLKAGSAERSRQRQRCRRHEGGGEEMHDARGAPHRNKSFTFHSLGEGTRGPGKTSSWIPRWNLWTAALIGPERPS